MEAPRDAAGDEPDEAHEEDECERVRRGGEHLPDEDLAALARAGEDRLERAVVALRGDDVARDERRDQREPPDRHEEEDHERHREARLADVAPERDVVRPAALQYEDGDEDDRDGDRGADPEIGALLREQLRDLPAIDPDHTGHTAISVTRSWSDDSPSVIPRNSSSRLAVSGTSAVNAMRAR